MTIPVPEKGKSLIPLHLRFHLSKGVPRALSNHLQNLPWEAFSLAPREARLDRLWEAQAAHAGVDVELKRMADGVGMGDTEADDVGMGDIGMNSALVGDTEVVGDMGAGSRVGRPGVRDRAEAKDPGTVAPGT